jgi:hypothetical protein
VGRQLKDDHTTGPDDAQELRDVTSGQIRQEMLKDDIRVDEVDGSAWTRRRAG